MRSILIRTLSSVLAVCLLAACQSDEEKSAAHLARGDAYLEEKQWNEAIIEYKNVLQVDPNSANAHYGLGKALLQVGKGREGFWEMRETIRLDPSNHDAMLQFSQLSIFAGEFEEAVERTDEVIAADPTNVNAYLVNGQALEALKQYAEAQVILEKAVEVAPDNRDALLILGNFHRHRGDRAAAEPYFVKGPSVENVFNAYLALAGFYAEDPDKAHDALAEENYLKALELAEGKDISRGYMVLGSFFFARERFEDCVAALEEGIGKAEDPLDVIYLLARIYRAKDMDEKADELAERAALMKPDDPRPHLVLSAHRGRLGDFAGALESANKAMELAPNDDSARLRKAEVMIELGFREGSDERVAAGQTIVEAVLAEEPSNPGALFVLAKLRLAEQKIDEAIHALRAAIDVKPDWAEAHFLLGTALAASGERTAARTELARALEIDPSLFEARRVLADVHAGLGEHEYAVEEARRYLKERPNSTTARVRVAQSLVLMNRFDDALTEIQKIEESDRDVQANYAIGRIYLAQKDDDMARQYLLAALEDMPAHPEILGSLLILDVRSDRLDESAERIRVALNLEPNNAKLRRLSGTLALRQDNAAAAEAAFKRGVELDPNDISGYRQLAEFYAGTGRTRETIEIYERALQVEPDQPQIHHFLGVLYEYGGQRELAIQHYEDAIEWAPNQAQSKNNLAYMYAEEGENLDRALDLAQAAKALMPDDPNAADTLGWVLYRRGVPSAAIAYLKEAEAGISPDDANLGLVRHHLALAYEASGNEERALETAELALEARDAYVEAQKARGAEIAAEPDWASEARALRERL